MPGIGESNRVLQASPPKLAGPLTLFGLQKRVYTTSRTLTADDLGCAIFTTGATTAVTFTLPSGVPGGADVSPFYLMICDHIEGMVVTAASNSMHAANLLTATTITTAANAGIGAMVWAFSNGDAWVANGFAVGTVANGGLTVA